MDFVSVLHRESPRDRPALPTMHLALARLAWRTAAPRVLRGAEAPLQLRSTAARLSTSGGGAASSSAQVLVERQPEQRTALVRLNRPKALNALCDDLMRELADAAKKLDDDPDVGAIVLAGSERAFAAGADIKEMRPRGWVDSYTGNALGHWTRLSQVQTPILAAVNGFALGGGCELAMMCDVVYAGDKAKFGQPEITLGTIPGCGGTQRLTRAVGKSKAMELILTGEQISADDALRLGLVARVFPAADLEREVLKIAAKIASFSKPAVQMAKEAVNVSLESSLAEGLRFERRLFHASFGTADRAEGMAAFTEKRPARWRHS